MPPRHRSLSDGESFRRLRLCAPPEYGGKSFAAKGEIENIILSSNADVIIIDPEREYSQLVKALGGEIINISATSQSHINAMDMNKEYGDGANPVILKSEFIMSL